MEAWMRDGACRGVSLDLFFPERGQSAEAARQICGSCPVLSACTAFALSNDGPLDGVVDGQDVFRFDDDDRRELAALKTELDAYEAGLHN